MWTNSGNGTAVGVAERARAFDERLTVLVVALVFRGAIDAVIARILIEPQEICLSAYACGFKSRQCIGSRDTAAVGVEVCLGYVYVNGAVSCDTTVTGKRVTVARLGWEVAE